MRRATCPTHPGRLVDKHPCQVCGYSLGNYQVQVVELATRGEDMASLRAVPNPQVVSRVDPDTGEIPGQLSMLPAPYETQRRAKDGMQPAMLRAFLGAFDWEGMGEGDQVTVKVARGEHVVTHRVNWKGE